MARYIVGRLAQSVVVLAVVLTASFFVMKAAPGSPLSNDRQLDPEVEAQLMELYRLDQPVGKQYLYYVGQLMKGDLGMSIQQRAPVSEIIFEAVPYSLTIGVQAMLFALLLGIPIGLLAGLKQNTPTDYGVMSVAMIGVSIDLCSGRSSS